MAFNKINTKNRPSIKKQLNRCHCLLCAYNLHTETQDKIVLKKQSLHNLVSEKTVGVTLHEM